MTAEQKTSTEDAKASEYLQCEGVLRLVLHLITSGLGRHESKDSLVSAQEAWLPGELERHHVHASERTETKIKSLIANLLDGPWIEWSQEGERWLLLLTERGKQAWDGNPAAPTIHKASDARVMVLRILRKARNEQSMWGDPRLLGQHVKIEDLFIWAAHFSVGKATCYEALQTIEARGWATKESSIYHNRFTGMAHSEARYRITQDGVEELHKIETGPRPGRVAIAPPPEIAASLPVFEADHRKSGPTAFIMMEFGKTPAHDRIVASIKATLKKHNIVGVRADDKQYHDEKWNNILTYMHGCSFGIAVFERLLNEVHNPNVAVEVGYMLGLGKKICLLKDKTLDRLLGDLDGRLYREFDPQCPDTSVPDVLEKWLHERGLVPT